MKKVDPTECKRILILDVNGLGVFQHYHGNEPEMQVQGTRVTLLLNADSTFYELSKEYNANAPVNVLDFINAQRHLKAKMFSMKGNIRNREKR